MNQITEVSVIYGEYFITNLGSSEGNKKQVKTIKEPNENKI